MLLFNTSLWLSLLTCSRNATVATRGIPNQQSAQRGQAPVQLARDRAVSNAVKKHIIGRPTPPVLRRSRHVWFPLTPMPPRYRQAPEEQERQTKVENPNAKPHVFGRVKCRVLRSRELCRVRRKTGRKRIYRMSSRVERVSLGFKPDLYVTRLYTVLYTPSHTLHCSAPSGLYPD